MEGDLEHSTPASGSGLSRLSAWWILWFLLHTLAVYAIVNFCTPWLAAWTRGRLLPILQEPSTRGSFEFLFSHIFAFSFIPAVVAGLSNARFKQKIAELVWVIPALVLTYKFFTFPAPSVFQSQFSPAFHQYFAGAFSVPEFYSWREFWDIVRSNPDMLRGKAQLDFTAPFYAGLGYSVAAWLARRTDLSRRVSEKVNEYEESRFGSSHEPARVMESTDTSLDDSSV